MYPDRFDNDEAEALIDLIRTQGDRFVAIGEVGLDRWILKRVAESEQTELEERHLVIRKDTPDAIATAFQIAQAQRHAV